MSSEPTFWTVMFSKPSFWILIGGVLIALGIGAKMLWENHTENSFSFGLLVIVALMSLIITFSILFG